MVMDYALLTGFLALTVLFSYLQTKYIQKRDAEMTNLMAHFYERSQRKEEKIKAEIDSLTRRLEAYVEVHTQFRELALEAVSRIGAVEKSTHTIQYVPAGSVQEMLGAVGQKLDPLSEESQQKFDALQESVLRDMEAEIPESI